MSLDSTAEEIAQTKDSTKEPQLLPATKVAQTSLSDPISTDTKPSPDGIEIIWEVPRDPVEGFIVRYGYNRDNLAFEIKLDSDTIEKFEHPAYGFVYRHTLPGISNDRNLYVSLASYLGDVTSAPSKIFEVVPSKVSQAKNDMED